MSSKRQTRGEYLSLTLAMLLALEERDLEKADLLEKKRRIFDVDEREQPHHLRQMEAHIFDSLTHKAPSWIEALLSYGELIDNIARPEAIGFLWKLS